MHIVQILSKLVLFFSIQVCIKNGVENFLYGFFKTNFYERVSFKRAGIMLFKLGILYSKVDYFI